MLSSLSWPSSLRCSSYSSLFSFLHVVCFFLLILALLYFTHFFLFVPPHFLLVSPHIVVSPVCSLHKSSHTSSPIPPPTPTPPPPHPSAPPSYQNPIHLHLPPPPPPFPTPRHSQSGQRDELEWRLGQERGVESQSQSQAGGQAQSRGAPGFTRYHRPLALSVEVSASSLLHLPSPTGLS